MTRRRSLPLETQCRALGLPAPEPEFYFARPRRWRFDWAWPECKVALEQEGVVYPTKARWHERADHRLGGRHTSVKGFRDDAVKYGEAAAMGWIVIRALPDQIASGEALSWVERAMKWSRIAGTRPMVKHRTRAPSPADAQEATDGSV